MRMLTLTIATGLLLPLVALATIVLLPFADRKTQVGLLGTYFSYLYTVVTLAGVLA